MQRLPLAQVTRPPQWAASFIPDRTLKGGAIGIVFLEPFSAGYARGHCYQHVQAITVAIDQYAEKALGNRDYFLNKPYGVG
jgi:hypothetical protein